MWSAIATACERDDFRPRPGRLCDFCTFKPYCPAHGGDPIDAAELRGPGTVIAPDAAARHRLSGPADADERVRQRHARARTVRCWIGRVSAT